MSTEPRTRRHIAGACSMGALAAGIVVAAPQSPTSPRGRDHSFAARTAAAVRRGSTLRTFETRRGATLTLAGDDLRPDPRH